MTGPGSRIGSPAPVGSALARCVGPDLTTFSTVHWGRTPWLNRADGDRFGDLLSVDGVDELLSVRGLRTPFLRVARNGSLIPPASYTGSGGLGAEIRDQVRDDRILDLVASGATLVLQGLHRLWPPLIDFCRTLGTELSCAVQANAYLTPAGNQGFSTHYDTHDVIVAQLAGRKRWRIHPPVLVDPLERQPWGGVADEVSATATGAPYLEAVLGAGDALYLPRGWLHAAEAVGDTSLHLTLGLRAPTRHSIVTALLELAAGDERLRTGFPPGVDLTDPDQLRLELKGTIEALKDYLDRTGADQVAGELRRTMWTEARPGPLRPLAQLAFAAALTADALITLRAGTRFRMVPGADDRVALILADRTVDLPARCEPALQTLLGGAAVRVGDLPGLDDDDERVVLARRLLREAVLVPG